MSSLYTQRPIRYHYLQGEGNDNKAVFEVYDDSALVSASLGLTTMKYKERMTVEEARTFYQQLQEKGWEKTDKVTTHGYIWDIYR